MAGSIKTPYNTSKRARQTLGAKRVGRTRTANSQQVYRPIRQRFGNQPFPKQLRNTLRYCDVINSTMTAGIAKHVFKANGMYDPDVTGVGHQPLYFDQVSAIYDHWTVVASRIRVVPMTAAGFNILFTLYMDDDTVTVTSAEEAMEQPNCKWTAINPSVAKIPTLYGKFNASASMGSFDPLAADSLKGTSVADPTELSYFVVQAHEESGSLNTTINYAIQIEYDVVWTELKTMGQS